MAGPEAEFFLFQPRRRTASRTTRPTTSAATSTSPRSTSARRRAATSSRCSSRWGSRSRRRTTRSPRASTRSTSATPTPSPPPTTSSPSASWSRRWPRTTACTPRSCPSRSSASTAPGMHTHQSLFDDKGSNVFFDAKGPHQLSKVARGYIAGILDHAARVRRGHQPAGQLLQAAGARVRGAGQRRVVGEEPLAARPRAGAARPRHPLRGAHARPVVQPLPGARRDARVRPRRDRARARLRRAGRPQHLRDVGAREAAAAASASSPATCAEALDNLERDKVVRDALGEHIFTNFLRNKREEWHRYISRRCTAGSATSTSRSTDRPGTARTLRVRRPANPSLSRGRSNRRPRRGSADHRP